MSDAKPMKTREEVKRQVVEMLTNVEAEKQKLSAARKRVHDLEINLFKVLTEWHFGK